jgi:hypothetical protein
MEEIAATLSYLGLSGGYHQAAADLYRWVGETRLGQERPESRDRSRTMAAAIAELAADHAARRTQPVTDRSSLNMRPSPISRSIVPGRG